MNDSATTAGGYVGSKMYTANLAAAKTTIQNAFGAAHIMTHNITLVNAVTSGAASGSVWGDVTVELPTNVMIFGCAGFANGGYNSDSVWRHLNLFRLRPDLTKAAAAYWLRDVVSASHFTRATIGGDSGLGGANGEQGVRPYFCIYQEAA